MNILPSAVPSCCWPPGMPFEEIRCSPPKPDEPLAPRAAPTPAAAPRPTSLEVAFQPGLDQIVMLQSAYHEARDYFAAQQPEAACLLLGPRKDEVVTHILIDDEGAATPVSFTLAAASLNQKVKPFSAAGLNIKGVWHLHPRGFTALSMGDLAYATSLFTNPKHQGLERFTMPITADGRFYGFVLSLDGNTLAVRSARLILI